jgi:exopolysaccharide production protein ExoQ
MSTSLGVTSSENRTINSLCRKIETIGVFILFLGFFDANLYSYRVYFNTISYAIAIFLVVLRWKRCIYVGTRDISLLLLVGMTLLSYFWSTAPDFTSIETKTIIRSALFGIYLAAQYNPKELMELFLKIFGIAAVLNLVYAGFAIATGQSHLAIAWTNNQWSWTGFLTHKQYFGRMMMHTSVLFVLSILSSNRFRRLKFIGLSISFLLLFLSKSTTSWTGFALALTLLPILKLARLNYKTRTILYMTVVLIVGTIALIIFSNLETIVVDVLHKPPDFNGRFDIWSLAIQNGLKRPWLGYGYSGFWTSSESTALINSTWLRTETGDRFHSHNGFIDLFLQLGIIGLILFAINFFSVIKRLINLIHTTKTIESFWMLEFLLLGFLMQITETLTLFSSHTMSSIYIAIGLSTIIWQNRIKRNIAYSS